MQVLYTFSPEPGPLRVYIDSESNTHELVREEAERVARRIATRGGYARVVFGGQTIEEHGVDPRHI